MGNHNPPHLNYNIGGGGKVRRECLRAIVIEREREIGENELW